ncbi:MAG: hypothetical protein IJO57_04865 [Bacilli bacterium]|nr:hypothetical protein [Bacilli bacterium]
MNIKKIDKTEESENNYKTESQIQDSAKQNSLSNGNTITEEEVLNAINKNFNINRKITNGMNKQIYNVFLEKINDFTSTNGDDNYE